MNKNAIQKYAIWARNELIEQVKQRAFQYGIDENGYGDENAIVIAGRVLSADEKRQRRLFVDKIKKSGYNQAVEDVSYTWFNRFIALRFMEVNDFLPTHIRVFSDTRGNFNPEILTNVLHLDLPGLDKAKVSEYLNGNKTEELYRYLLLTQCNALNDALPEMFEKLGGYTEMLLPNNILKQDSVLARLVKDIDEDDWKDAVQIIGWMYQYYNTEPKQAVFSDLKKKVKITKEKIPAATQLFTPDWIVRYMVENSLGRLWLESHPNPILIKKWKYYLDEAEQAPEVAERLRVLRSQSPVKSPEDIRLIDPCMGSGHILVYAFDVLMQIYESEGYNPRDAAELILEKNIYGLDIDLRAYQLAYFSLMMKARQYNRRIFTDGVKPQVYHPAGFPDGEEYGSLVKVDKLEPMPELPKEQQMTLFDGSYDAKLNAWNFKRLLAQKYDVVVTNPPYMGGNGMGTNLSDFVKKNYPDSKSDLSTAFMEQTLYLCKPTGFMAMINIPVWMFITSYEKLRQKLLSGNTIVNLLHFGRGVFGADFGTTSFVIRKGNIKGYYGTYRKLYKQQGSVDSISQKEEWFFSDMGFFHKQQEKYMNIPGSPIAYSLNDVLVEVFATAPQVSKYASPKQGMSTCDVDRFVKRWHEIDVNRTNIYDPDNILWVKYNKGGEYRKWFGNREFLVYWNSEGDELRANNAALRNRDVYFQRFLAWTKVTISTTGFRWFEDGFLFDGAGGSLFTKNQCNALYLLGYLNSIVAADILKVISPTVNYNENHIGTIPVIISNEQKFAIEGLVERNIEISRFDWDAFETSWDFITHPLIAFKCGAGYTDVPIEKWQYRIKDAFDSWSSNAKEQFKILKRNEEELNRIFIDIYGLSNELTPEVEEKDVTVRRADLGREIRSLISYAVGCMFGRYSLDTDGLAYAGGAWDSGKYKTLPVDKDNILPICDDDYFDDDITGRFVDFVKIVYGADTLEENLKFIADALGGKGTPRGVIRNYFLNDFYKDHVKIYQKRPIYWLFDSGKKNGFKALIYMHRYSRDLLAKLRTDYVHEQQERYRTQLSHIASALNTASGADRAKLLKQQDKLTEQLREITEFEEKVHHLADQNIMIDLDNGVKKNYKIFADVLAKI
ncbi:TPA: BREX-1 system adenine-specific DNA-methyltransferase PglX [Streptococcus suis]